MFTLYYDKNETATQPKKASTNKIINYDYIIAILLLLIALPILHFGGFAGQYIKGTFYFDVHPNLAKILIAWSGQLFGYQGDFDFGLIGNSYENADVPYVQMRIVCAILGALLVPMAYITLRDGNHSIQASLITAIAVCFENSLVTNNRFILLDAYLLFFMAWSLMSWNKFYKNRAFSFYWWFWLSMTGIGLGCTVSCKWVGLFIIATIGCSTISQLWKIWGNLQVTKTQFAQHFMARFICLIVVPIVIYISIFYLHFSLLPLSGPGDSHMSSHFQHSLKGHEIEDSPEDIFYGSKVTIRHLGTNGGYLHSHLSTYPEGSQQQQITLYPYQDENNWWIIKRMNITEEEATPKHDVLGSDNETWLEYVRHGDVIRLEHINTSPKKLHSHDVKPPISDGDNYKEVSAYGFEDYEGDSNDYWRVDIPTIDKDDNGRLKTLHTSFRLLHPLQSCALYSGEKKLPEWGFGQQEVACIQNGKLPKTLWMIEETRHDLLSEEQTTMVNYPKQTFWEKFKELHITMWTANKDLTETHPYQSRPIEWPMLRSGISYWARDEYHIYFIGNPLIYWISTISLFTFLILTFFFTIRSHRRIQEKFNPRAYQFYQQQAGYYTMAWCFHYFPFYLMGRQLFLHHYLPALYCAILVFGVGVDVILQKWMYLSNQWKSWMMTWSVVIMFTMMIISVFWIFMPLSYGLEWQLEACKQAEWLPLWDFGCSRYDPAFPTPLFTMDVDRQDPIVQSILKGSQPHIEL
ncbi:unnamed protein product [Cunninghamella echinulata]